VFAEFCHACRGKGNTVFIVFDFFRDADDHGMEIGSGPGFKINFW
jgi:hypothetical protein